ncbi:MAG: tRNA adenosine(34) deaminase TadA [Terriglobia bacterium]
MDDLEHEKFMRLALREAKRAGDEGEVPVGAVVVQNGQVVARAHNRPIRLHDPAGHAEVLALRRAAKRLGNYRLPGCSLYVTIEPCAMCAGAIIHARIGHVIFGARDLKAGACGSVLKVLNHRSLNHRVQLSRGVLAEDAASVLREFFKRRRQEHKNATKA